MIHIVFNEMDVKVMEQAIELDAALAGEVWLIRDDYAVGPIANLDTPDGWQHRRDWWRKLLEIGGDYTTDDTLAMVNDQLTVHQLIQQLTQQTTEKVWIWAAQNKHDVCGYYWLLSKLQDFLGRIFILYLNNLPFINEKGAIFYPNWLMEIPAKEFIKAKKLARIVTASEWENDAEEWQKLCAANQMVRLLEGGKKINSADVAFYDDKIDQYVTGDFTKAARIIAQFLQKEKETTGDVFVLWRLKSMISTKNYSVKGDAAKSGREFELMNPLKPSLKRKADAAELNN